MYSLDPALKIWLQIRLAFFVFAFLALILSPLGHTPLGFVLGIIITYQIINAFSGLMRFAERARFNQGVMRETNRRQFHGADLPRQIFYLLLGVAEADGTASQDERQLVRHFMLKRFYDKSIAEQIARWEQAPQPVIPLQSLAANIGKILTPSEKETVFTWSCLVAFIDGRFREQEHSSLQKVAKGFGLHPVHAKRLFQHAKQHAMTARSIREELGRGGYGAGGFGTGGADGHQGGWRNTHSRGRGPGGGDRYHQRQHTRPQPTAGQRRDAALQILGLDSNADDSTIRKRYRDLAKKHHPDAHSHLGEVAAEEATTRFREIQQAYEDLVGS